MVFRKSLSVIALFITLISCTSKQDITINSSGKGSCTFSVELDSFFIDYLRDLSDAAGSGSDNFSVFERAAIEEAFNQYSDAVLSDVRISGSGKLEVDLSFSNPEEILKENTRNPVLKFSRKGNTSLLSFNLNMDNYSVLSRLVGLADNPVLSALTPQPDNPYSNDEYLDMVDFVFSDYKGGDMAALTVSRAMVEINIKTEGKVLRADNGRITDTGVAFRIPLLKFLTLSSPVEFSVEYR